MTKLCLFVACAFLALQTGFAQAAPRYAAVEGSISAIDTAGIPPTVTIGSTTLNVLPSTVIVLEGRGRVSLSALTVDALAEAKYDTRTLNAKQIKVAAEEEVEENATVIGEVIDADPVSGTVTVDTTGDGVADLTVTANAQTKIEVDGLHLTLADLDTIDGLQVKVEYLTTSFVALEIEAANNSALTASGTVTAVDPVAGTITIDTAAGPLTFEVAEGAEIKVGSQRVALDAIQVGDTVEVRYVTDGTVNTALRISVRPVQPKHITGVITAVDAVAGTLTVSARGATVALTLTDGTDLRINGRAATLADVAAALTAGRTVKVSASYVVRAGVNNATKVQINVQGRGRR